MKLELALLAFFAAIVPQTLAQVDPSLVLSLLQPDLKLPPKVPQSIRQYYRTPAQQRAARQRARQQQEMDLYRRLKAMSVEEIKQFESKLTPTQLRQLVSRLKYLEQQQRNQQQSSTPTPGGSGAGSNVVLSGANRIRRPVNSVNGVGSGGRPGTSNSRRPAPASKRRGYNPIQAIKSYQSYRKKAMSALAAGCTYPMGMESTLDSFMVFSHGGCRRGGAICYMAGQSCVDVGHSIMCCPPGYSTGTLDMLSYMKQMRAFMAQFQ